MKIIATTRTRNESSNIRRFCEVYARFCDEVIVVDGGSEDGTVSIAREMPKTFVYDFHERVEGKNGLWRNPHGKHINECIRRAKEHGADWMIFDDCDDFPNYLLQNDFRNLVSDEDFEVLMLPRFYIYGETEYFSKLSHVDKENHRALWAWNVKRASIWAREDDPWKHELEDFRRVKKKNLNLPYCLLHYFAPNEDVMKRKTNFYVSSGQHPSLKTPVETYPLRKPLPDYARINE